MQSATVFVSIKMVSFIVAGGERNWCPMSNSLQFKKRQWDYAGECYLESHGFIFTIQRPIHPHPTRCFVARRFRKKGYDRSWFCDINKDGHIVQGCTLPMTSIRTAKQRIVKAFNQRYKPKYLTEFEDCLGCGKELVKPITDNLCETCRKRYGD